MLFANYAKVSHRAGTTWHCFLSHTLRYLDYFLTWDRAKSQSALGVGYSCFVLRIGYCRADVRIDGFACLQGVEWNICKHLLHCTMSAEGIAFTGEGVVAVRIASSFTIGEIDMLEPPSFGLEVSVAVAEGSSSTKACDSRARSSDGFSAGEQKQSQICNRWCSEQKQSRIVQWVLWYACECSGCVRRKTLACRS